MIVLVEVEIAFAEADVPFADQAGAVAGPFEHRGRGRFGGVHRQRRFAVEDAGAGGVAPGVLAGDEGVAGRRADGAGGVGVGEAEAFARKPVAMRRLDGLRAVTAEVAVADVVGKDEDDVGRSGEAWRGDGFSRPG